jgi:ABC-type uncharacterized transport system ATPase subunit
VRAGTEIRPGGGKGFSTLIRSKQTEKSGEKMDKGSVSDIQRIEALIYIIRGQKVMLDADLAALFGVETRVLKQAVRRNRNRFPSDFMLQLTKEENRSLRSQIVILEPGRYSKYLAFAFTEQGLGGLPF